MNKDIDSLILSAQRNELRDFISEAFMEKIECSDDEAFQFMINVGKGDYLFTQVENWKEYRDYLERDGKPVLPIIRTAFVSIKDETVDSIKEYIKPIYGRPVETFLYDFDFNREQWSALVAKAKFESNLNTISEEVNTPEEDCINCHFFDAYETEERITLRGRCLNATCPMHYMEVHVDFACNRYIVKGNK